MINDALLDAHLPPIIYRGRTYHEGILGSPSYAFQVEIPNNYEMASTMVEFFERIISDELTLKYSDDILKCALPDNKVRFLAGKVYRIELKPIFKNDNQVFGIDCISILQKSESILAGWQCYALVHDFLRKRNDTLCGINLVSFSNDLQVKAFFCDFLFFPNLCSFEAIDISKTDINKFTGLTYAISIIEVL